MNKSRFLKTDSIILKTTTAGEINRYFTFISPDVGIQQATAFGALKHKSKFCSAVQSFVRATLYLSRSKKSNYLKLEDIDNVSLNSFISSNINNLYLSSFFSDVLINSFFSPEEFRSHFYLILYSLDLLEKKGQYSSFLFFSIKFLFLSGYKFNLTRCLSCGKESDTYFFDVTNGGVFCDKDTKNKNIKISAEATKLWETFYIEKYIILKEKDVDPYLFKDIFKVLITIFKSIFEKKLTTFSFLEEVFK